ncbi:MAG: class I SAM-dependent methyltransferase [Deinococcales bacterium]
MNDDNTNREQLTEANRKAWNETAAIHANITLKALLEGIQKPDYSTLDVIEEKIFAELGIQDKAIIQLSCNNGRELLSLKKRGAGRCMGVDISDDFIAQARELAKVGQLEAEFIRSDVYELKGYDEAFDIVYITIGALGWLPDLKSYLALIQRLLRPGGHVFIYEMHPILDMFDPDKALNLQHSYFRTKPYVSSNDPDYMDPSQRVSETSYWFHHKLSDIIGGLAKEGLSLVHFCEYDHDISEVFKEFAKFEKRLPMCYSLVAEKTLRQGF